MRASIRTFLGLTVGVALFAPTTTHAQTIPSNYTYLEQKQETGPFIGYMTSQTGRFGYGPKGGSVLGVRWGIEAAGPISFEGVVGTVNGERDLINPGRDEGDRVVGQTNTLLTTVERDQPLHRLWRRTRIRRGKRRPGRTRHSGSRPLRLWLELLRDIGGRVTVVRVGPLRSTSGCGFLLMETRYATGLQ